METEINEALLVIYPDGRVWWSRSVVVQLTCTMDFRQMPYDTQKCPLVSGSYSSDASVVKVVYPRGRDGTPGTGDSIVGTVPDLPAWDYHGSYTWISAPVFSGIEWSYMNAEFVLKRREGYYLYAVYIPTIAFNFLSYCSFFISRKFAAPRVSLALIPILISVTMLQSIYQKLPSISYSTWLQTYLLGAVVMNIAMMAQFAVVHCFARNEERMARLALRADRWQDIVSGTSSRIRRGNSARLGVESRADKLPAEGASESDDEGNTGTRDEPNGKGEIDIEEINTSPESSTTGSRHISFAGKQQKQADLRLRRKGTVTLDEIKTKMESNPSYQLPQWLQRNFEADLLNELCMAFGRIDTDGQGSVDVEEIISLCQDLGLDLLEDEQVRLIRYLDTKCSGDVDLEEFVYGMLKARGTAPKPGRSLGDRWLLWTNELVYWYRVNVVNLVFRGVKVSKLIDFHSRWVFLMVIVFFNLYMFSIKGSF